MKNFQQIYYRKSVSDLILFSTAELYNLSLSFGDRQKKLNLKICSVIPLYVRKSGDFFFFAKFGMVKQIISFMIVARFSVNFGWFVRFGLAGYNFTLKNRLRRSLLKLNLGYSRHKFILNIPEAARTIVRKKRHIYIFSNNFYLIFSMGKYIQNLRNVLPYKIRGLILEGSKTAILKQGKKTKYK
jgi:ribosomal protein L6P/L9E